MPVSRGAIALSILSTLFSLGAAELGARWVGVPVATPRLCPNEQPSAHSENFAVDARFGWRMHPNQRFTDQTEGREIEYAADAEGFRANGSGEQPKSGPLVVLAGDSYVWGYGVEYEESSAGQLEARMGVRVRNLAMPGFAVDQIWLSLRHEGLESAPELVVVALYPDDFERSFSAFRTSRGLKKPAFRIRDGALVEGTPADCPNAIARWLEAHSSLFSLWRRVEVKLARDFGIGEWWELNAAILDQIREDCRKAGVRVVFVHIPYTTWRPFPALAAYMRAHAAEHVDLYEDWGPQGPQNYLPNDGHLNPAGLSRLADLIIERAGL